jgi:hypothetical protein
VGAFSDREQTRVFGRLCGAKVRTHSLASALLVAAFASGVTLVGLVAHAQAPSASSSSGPALLASARGAASVASAAVSASAWAPASASAGVLDPASAADADPASLPAAASSAPAPVASSVSSAAPVTVTATCIEHLPPGATRPRLVESFPPRGFAGYALPLVVLVEHGAGETVLPEGFSLRDDATGLSDLRKAGFTFPAQTGGSPAKVKVLDQKAKSQNQPSGGNAPARTELTIPVLALPKEPGTKELTLPPLPISVSRASGEVMTLCTAPHTIRVEDPTANVPVAAAKPKANPPGRRQLEDWEAARIATYAAGVGLVGVLLGALLARWWRRRPKVLPPPPPPRPAWEIALTELAALRQGPLLEQDHLSEYVDALSDIARRYLGARFGFDGAESTSREVRKALRAVTPPPPVLPDIEVLLDESDLVKFARVSPALHDCTALSDRVETIIRQTIPLFEPDGAVLAVPKVGAASASPARSKSRNA